MPLLAVLDRRSEEHQGLILLQVGQILPRFTKHNHSSQGGHIANLSNLRMFNLKCHHGGRELRAPAGHREGDLMWWPPHPGWLKSAFLLIAFCRRGKESTRHRPGSSYQWLWAQQGQRECRCATGWTGKNQKNPNQEHRHKVPIQAALHMYFHSSISRAVGTGPSPCHWLCKQALCVVI